MSALTIKGSETGTATFAVVAPQTDTDRNIFLPDNNGTLGFAGVPKTGTTKTTSYTLAAGDIGQLVEIGTGGSVIVPNSIFTTGDIISIFNNTSSNVTVSFSSVTSYVSGVNTARNSVSLLTRGLCSLLFIDSSTCVILGSVT